MILVQRIHANAGFGMVQLRVLLCYHTIVQHIAQALKKSVGSQVFQRQCRSTFRPSRHHAHALQRKHEHHDQQHCKLCLLHMHIP